jgi:hypothetical protein
MVIVPLQKNSPNIHFVGLTVQTYRYKYKSSTVYEGVTITIENAECVRLLGIKATEIESQWRDT